MKGTPPGNLFCPAWLTDSTAKVPPCLKAATRERRSYGYASPQKTRRARRQTD